MAFGFCSFTNTRIHNSDITWLIKWPWISKMLFSEDFLIDGGIRFGEMKCPTKDGRHFWTDLAWKKYTAIWTIKTSNYRSLLLPKAWTKNSNHLIEFLQGFSIIGFFFWVQLFCSFQEIFSVNYVNLKCMIE